MDKVATDLTRILGPERLLWEREHLATYEFDGTAALYAEAGCVALPKTTAEVTQVVRYGFKRRQRAGTRLYRALSSTDGSGSRTRPKEPHHSRRERRGDPKSGRARRCRRATLSARSGFDEDFNDRRQRSGELRRFART